MSKMTSICVGLAECNAAIEEAIAREQERCAAICDEVAEKWKLDAWNSKTPKGADEAMNIANGATACAAAIRQTIGGE